MQAMPSSDRPGVLVGGVTLLFVGSMIIGFMYGGRRADQA
jgi:hypothetical protein